MSLSSILAFVLKWIPKETLIIAVAKVIKDYILPKLTPTMFEALAALVREIFAQAPELVAAAMAPPAAPPEQ